MQFNLRIPASFRGNNAFRRNDVPWLTRDRLFAALMTIPPRGKRQNQFSAAKAGAMKNRRRTRFARDIYFHICAVHTYSRSQDHQRRSAHVRTRAKRMHVVHRTQRRVPIGVTVRCIRGTRVAIPGVRREARLISQSRL